MRCAAWLWLLACAQAWAATGMVAVTGSGDDDAAALALPSAAPGVAATPRAAAVTIEAAGTLAAQSAGEAVRSQRLSVDARLDGSWASGWRAMLAERLDASRQDSLGGDQEVATLKEAYVSWQPLASSLLDAGRINARQGVAVGYNPTDYWRSDAIRSAVSLDPNSLRDNRLGTVMLRATELWGGGAFSAIYAPELSVHSNSAAFDPDWAATNSRGRWMLSLSQQLASGFSPQWLAYGEQGRAAQVGCDLTVALGAATVAYLEVSAGRSASLLAQASGTAERQSYRTRAAAGVTYSFANKLTLTVEYDYNGTGLDGAPWSALRAGNLAVYARYRKYALSQQDLATQSNALVYASWQDLVLRHLDLTAFLRKDLIDHSRLPWLELRRHWNSLDFALRWQDVFGAPLSNFGASPQRQTWQLLLDYYL